MWFYKTTSALMYIWKYWCKHWRAFKYKMMKDGYKGANGFYTNAECMFGLSVTPWSNQYIYIKGIIEDRWNSTFNCGWILHQTLDSTWIWCMWTSFAHITWIHKTWQHSWTMLRLYCLHHDLWVLNIIKFIYSWFPTTRWFYDLDKTLLIFLLCYPSPNSLSRKEMIVHSMFKIEVFNALQMRFGPSKYTSLRTTLQNATPNWKWRRHLQSSI